MKLLEAVLSKKKVWRAIVIVLFVDYCFFILWETLLSRRVKSTRTYELRLFWGFIELITGEGNGVYVVKQYLLNILFFIPFGFLFPRNDKWWVPVLIACIFSMLIEFTQYATARGLCELDDVIANSVGAAIGVVLVNVLIKFVNRFIVSNRVN